MPGASGCRPAGQATHAAADELYTVPGAQASGHRGKLMRAVAGMPPAGTQLSADLPIANFWRAVLPVKAEGESPAMGLYSR